MLCAPCPPLHHFVVLVFSRCRNSPARLNRCRRRVLRLQVRHLCRRCRRFQPQFFYCLDREGEVVRSERESRERRADRGWGRGGEEKERAGRDRGRENEKREERESEERAHVRRRGRCISFQSVKRTCMSLRWCVHSHLLVRSIETKNAGGSTSMQSTPLTSRRFARGASPPPTLAPQTNHAVFDLLLHSSTWTRRHGDGRLDQSNG